jgi:GNAT superfamily N-acetyltransferase
MEQQMPCGAATGVRIRTAAAADRPALAAMLSRCTGQTLHRRFLAPLRSFPEPYLSEALSGHADHLALVASTPTAVVALGSCRATGDGTADLAILVEDAWQRQGVGTRLLTRLLEHAERHSIRRLKATMLAEQDWIMWALRAFGSCTATGRSGVLEVTLSAISTGRAWRSGIHHRLPVAQIRF